MDKQMSDQILRVNDILALLLGIDTSDPGPPRLRRTNIYGVPGTTCSGGCHPEPFQSLPIPYLCKNVGLLGFGAGAAAGPWVEGPLAYVAYTVGTATGAYGAFGCE